jgi:mono/diheme cytochrome c family protein
VRGTFYQTILIALLIATIAIFGVFLQREIYPEYKIYQRAYADLEIFRSKITREPPPPFEFGVKQIVLSKADQGPETIDRCTSCHVALQIDYFSPTKIAHDINGDVIRDSDGIPVKIPNEQYVFHQIDAAIQKQADPAQIKRLQALKTVEVNGHTIELSKVLGMHPLMGKELRPFEFHSPNEMGCTACHNGNGRALTAEKAHGPVFDGQYEEAFEGPKPHFLESDPANDPPFSRVFNHKPGHQLLFQTTPLFVGGLIEANCVQCHRSTPAQIEGAVNAISYLNAESQRRAALLQSSDENAKEALMTLWATRQSIENAGVPQTLAAWQKSVNDYTQPERLRAQIAARLHYLQAVTAGQSPEAAKTAALQRINADLLELVGSQTLVDDLLAQLGSNEAQNQEVITAFVSKHAQSPEATGRLFHAARAAQDYKQTLKALEQAQANVSRLHKGGQGFMSEVDLMTPTYLKGQEYFMSQACYACHRINGFARGGVGPELTQSGYSYPWFLKQKIVWPQGDLKTSTMPNMRLDHIQLEALVTFLLAQKGQMPAISEVDHQISMKQWEAGKKLPWEEPLTPDLIHNLDHSMTIFATEGCAACHRLKGFVSDVGFAVERDAEPNLATLTVEREWFRRLIPELVVGIDIPGSLLVNQLEQYADEIDQRIVNHVRQDSLLERIETEHPGLLESFYSNFIYARRHKNNTLTGEALARWQNRVHRVLMTYIQEYGLGRLVGPRPNWSGIYRSDEWLMEHFREPSALIARSLMPVFPFDTTKFAALTYMLDQLGQRNLERNHAVWDLNGFNPAEAYHIYCSQCHGVAERRDEAPVAQWVYPIPKNLRNAVFLQNLTRPRIIDSITHGVKGTPMPPWGETPADKPFTNTNPVLRPDEVVQLADWLLRLVPDSSDRGRGGPTVPKWEYTPEDVLEELKREGDTLENLNPQAVVDPGAGLFAALTPTPTPTDESVAALFDIVENPDGINQKTYYIKRKYYTPENLNAGQEYFRLNCAVCHGSEGGGDGSRAGEMSDAKPRMFTNAIWGRTRDDLRLLRSIKYGVPGTSMVPWGDLTSSLQRLQLVIYIRHLSENIEAKDELSEALYQAFDKDAAVIRNARIQQYASVNAAKAAYESVKQRREELDKQIRAKPTLATEAVSTYEREIQTLNALHRAEAADQRFRDLLNALASEETLYERTGKALLNAQVDPDVFAAFLALIRLNNDRYQISDGQLQMQAKPTREDQEVIMQKIFAVLDQKIQALNSERQSVKGQITSAEQREALRDIDTKIKNLEKLKNELTSLVADATRLRDQQLKYLENP